MNLTYTSLSHNFVPNLCSCGVQLHQKNIDMESVVFTTLQNLSTHSFGVGEKQLAKLGTEC